MTSNRQFTPKPTADGSYTFFSTEFQETFHSSFGAKQEAKVRYIKPCQIEQLAKQQSTIRLLDVCYGLGYNSAAALEAAWSVNPQCRIELIALELRTDVPRQAIAQNLLSSWQFSISELLAELAFESSICRKFLTAKLILGDARQTIQAIAERNWQADAIFLDPFSPPKCPQLWTVEFIEQVARCLAPKGRLATYSCSAAVRIALLNTGLHLGSVTGAGRKSPGTICSFSYNNLPELSEREREHLQTRAAIPYRDRTLQDSREQIIDNRQREQQTSSLESTSKWRKRWLM